MVTRGRNICNTLKAIRKQIADANEIEYSPEECHFKGECKGTTSVRDNKLCLKAL